MGVCLSEHLSGPLPSSGDRPFYLSVVFSTSQVLFPFKGPSSLESRHYVLLLVRSASLCVSSILDDSKSSGEGRSGRSRVSTDSALLAAETMVPQVVISSCGSSEEASVSLGLVHATPVTAASSKNRNSASLSVAVLSLQSKQSHLYDRTAVFSAEAVRDSTRTTYDSNLECFFVWCARFSDYSSSASLGQVADFLVFLFDKGLSVSTIRFYRFTIASCHFGLKKKNL